MGDPTITTVGESLYWSYANLAMAHAAVEDGVETYETKHFMIRMRLYSGLRKGTMSLGPFSAEDRLKMILPQTCSYCGGTDHLSLDHVVPRRLGGGDSGDNLVWACRSCNSSKGGRDLLEWMQKRGEFPPVLLLRRYLKLVMHWCEVEGLMDTPLSDIEGADLPFSLSSVPHDFPAPSKLKLWSVPLPE